MLMTWAAYSTTRPSDDTDRTSGRRVAKRWTGDPKFGQGRPAAMGPVAARHGRATTNQPPTGAAPPQSIRPRDSSGRSRLRWHGRPVIHAVRRLWGHSEAMEHTSSLEHRSPLGRRSGPIRCFLERLENWLFADEDALARARGWTIRRTRGGLGRVYRDPRWDGVRRGAPCSGVTVGEVRR